MIRMWWSTLEQGSQEEIYHLVGDPKSLPSTFDSMFLVGERVPPNSSFNPIAVSHHNSARSNN